MSLKLKTSGKGAVFEFEDGGFMASFTLSTEDDQAKLISKLERMLAFLQREEGVERAERWSAGSMAVPKLPLEPHHARQDATPFTGAPVVRPPALEDSVAQATANGWELYTGDDD